MQKCVRMNQDTRGRGTHVNGCFNWCIFLLKMSFHLMSSLTQPMLSNLQGELKSSPTQASSIHPGKIEKVANKNQRHNEVSRVGLLVVDLTGLWIELKRRNPSLGLSSLCLFCSQILVPLLEWFALLPFFSSGHVNVSLASLLQPLY